ncbi:MAG: serine/threonine protein kinase [Lentisphaerae bacterium]|nr:serine/threonine protein kinase [Lentisphaerota bacterium]
MADENEVVTAEDAKATSIATDAVKSMNCKYCDAQIDVSELDAFTEIECPQCGQHETVPAQLGPFRLLRLLGTGGMGGVYHAYDETLGRNVAIKVMLKSLGVDGDFVETFKREAQAVAKLNHPHIAQIYSFGQEKGQPYIVMELINGRHMDEMIEQERSLSEALVLRIALEISQGLAAADKIGLIHGDIKPENILLDDKGNSKLVDFGLATFTNQQSQDGIWGTPYYIAPEKVRRQRVDARSDIYSLGAALFHALTGKPPFDGDTPVDVVKARLTDPAPRVSSVREDIDEDVDRIVARMLESEPGRRYPTYASLIGDIEKTLKKLGPAKGASQAVKSKKVIIRKKGAPPPSTSPGTGPVSAAPKSSKIVVSRSGRSLSSTSIPAIDDKPEELDEPEKPRRGKKVAIGCLIALLLLGLAGGGATYGYLRVKQKAKEALLTAQEAALNDLRGEGAAICDKMGALLSDFARSEAAAMAFYQKSAADVMAVDSASLAAPQPPLEPKREPDPLPLDTNALAVAAEGTNTNVVVEAAVPAEPEPIPEPAAAPEAIAAPSEPDSLIMGVGKRVVEACETIMKLHAEARRVVGQATALNDNLNACDTILEATPLAADLALLQEPLPGLLRRTREALARAKESSEKTAELRTGEGERLRAERAAAAEVARQQAEREAAERKAAEAKARIEAEIARANMTPESVRDEVTTYRYRDAARKLEREVGTFETDGGRAAMQAVVERYMRLEELKLFLIKQLTAKPFSWGYVEGANRLDILSASNVGIRLKDRTVRWRDISTRQMFLFIQNYVRDGALSQGVKLRELADLNLAAAIFCAINGGEPAARRYADSAIRLLSTMQDEVNRLVPFSSETEE